MGEPDVEPESEADADAPAEAATPPSGDGEQSRAADPPPPGGGDATTATTPPDAGHPETGTEAEAIANGTGGEATVEASAGDGGATTTEVEEGSDNGPVEGDGAGEGEETDEGGDGEEAGAGTEREEDEEGAEGDEAPTGWRRWRARVRIVGFALAGALLALAVAGRVSAQIGPFDSTVAARPSLAGQTTVHLAPLGTIVLDTHDWPLAIDLTADQISLREAENIAENPDLINTELGDEVADDVRDALERLAVRCMLLAVVGGVVGALIARLSWRSAVTGIGTSALLVACTGAGTAASFDANAVAEPRYTGLLTAAPAAVGDIETIVDRYGEYRAQLSDLVGNVVTLYLAAEDLPTFAPDDDTIRILHVSDVHLNPQAFDLMRQVTDQFGIDAIVDTGDLVDWGTGPETRLVDEIGRLDVPYVYVRGNHDSHLIQDAVADQSNAVVLDGDAAEVAGLRFWGIGDPRYTPNKDRPMDAPSEQEEARAFAPEVAQGLAAAEPPDVDVVMVHDERMAADLGGQVPLVLAGHTHSARESHIDPLDEDEAAAEAGDGRGDDQDEATTTTTTEADRDSDGDGEQELEPTRLLVSGSTGGAGLRGLQGEEPHPLAAAVLYFDPDDHQLLAYDSITLQGFGETGATIARHILVQDGNGNDGGAGAAAEP